MKKVILGMSVMAFTSSLYAGNESISGTWECHTSSEYAELDSSLRLNDDGSYKKEWSLFGSTHVELGSWSVVENRLVLERSRYIKNNDEEESSQVFDLEIITSTTENLEYKNDNSETKCNNS